MKFALNWQIVCMLTMYNNTNHNINKNWMCTYITYWTTAITHKNATERNSLQLFTLFKLYYRSIFVVIFEFQVCFPNCIQ